MPLLGFSQLKHSKQMECGLVEAIKRGQDGNSLVSNSNSSPLERLFISSEHFAEEKRMLAAWYAALNTM